MKHCLEDGVIVLTEDLLTGQSHLRHIGAFLSGSGGVPCAMDLELWLLKLRDLLGVSVDTLDR